MARTVLISDLHLANGPGTDLLGREFFRERLWPALEGADRLILLGDAIELRDHPIAEVLSLVSPFFEELGELTRGAEIVLVPGNHDHNLLGPWLAERRLRGGITLETEERFEARAGEWGALGEIVARLGRESITVSYPGLRLRDDVWATHGHYLDAHLTIPTFERLGIAALERLLGERAGGRSTPGDYELYQGPIYELLYALAQSVAAQERSVKPHASARAWSVLRGGSGGPAAALRAALLGSVVFPSAVGIANRLGIGPFRSDLSAEEIARSGTRALGETVRRLGIEAEHVIFGHTHRCGHLPGDPPGEWIAPTGARLHNVGSWVWSEGIAGESSHRSGYWPGTIGILEDDEPPRLEHLLDDLSREEIESHLGTYTEGRLPPE